MAKDKKTEKVTPETNTQEDKPTLLVVDRDKQLCGAELKERGLSFEASPWTPYAHDLVKERGATRDPFLRNSAIYAAKNRNLQFNRAEMEARLEGRALAIKRQEEDFCQRRDARAQAINLRPDPSAPQEVACAVTKLTFTPKIGNKVDKDLKPISYDKGPKEGEPKVFGNFLPGKNGVPIPVSRKGMEILSAKEDRRVSGLSFEEAEYLSGKHAGTEAAANEVREMRLPPRDNRRSRNARTEKMRGEWDEDRHIIR